MNDHQRGILYVVIRHIHVLIDIVDSADDAEQSEHVHKKLTDAKRALTEAADHIGAAEDA